MSALQSYKHWGTFRSRTRALSRVQQRLVLQLGDGACARCRGLLEFSVLQGQLLHGRHFSACYSPFHHTYAHPAAWGSYKHHPSCAEYDVPLSSRIRIPNLLQIICLIGKKRKEKTTPFGVNFVGSPVLY